MSIIWGELLKTFHERLQECRKRKSLTQRQLASLLGITERSFQRYELGEREPNIAGLIRLADILEVDLNYLVGREEVTSVTKINFIDLSAPTAHSLLTVEKGHIPRVGEWIEVDDKDGWAQVYEVTQVLHSSKNNTTDVFVENPQPAEKVRTNLHQKTLQKYS